MRDIELAWGNSEADRERLTLGLFNAVSAALDGGITMITIEGDMAAGVAPASQIVQEHPDTVTIPRSDLTALLAGAAALGKYPADVPGLLQPLVDDVLKRYKVKLEMTP